MTRRIAKILFFSVALTQAAADAAVRRMFVTSVAGNGDLGSWPDAGPATGAAAGDAICQARAATAGLSNPSGFRAWLSTDTDDAYCRVHGLTGRKADNCGQATLPAAAGPWRRTDGASFGAGIVDLLSPGLLAFRPPRVDENGNTVHALVWTGTGSDGVAHFFGTCSGWVSGSGSQQGEGGVTDDTGTGWTAFGGDSCDAVRHLLCLEIGTADPLPQAADWGRLAFVTSVYGTGDLSSWPDAGGQNGVAAGDAICRARATAAGLPNASSFKAWLSSAAVDARDRFTSSGPWMRLDRVRIALGLADLTDGYLRAPLNLTETGEYLGSSLAWTGTDEAGLAVPERCNDWSSASGVDLGQTGMAHAGDGDWTFWDISVTGGHCSGFSHLDCLQDLPMVFADGFESSDTSVWSATVP